LHVSLRPFAEHQLLPAQKGKDLHKIILRYASNNTIMTEIITDLKDRKKIALKHLIDPYSIQRYQKKYFCLNLPRF